MDKFWSTIVATVAHKWRMTIALVGGVGYLALIKRSTRQSAVQVTIERFFASLTLKTKFF
jgi:hypothetical protein